jgi:hypothetical protein
MKRILFYIKRFSLAENLILGPVFEWLKQESDHSKTGQKYFRFFNVNGMQMSGI